MQTMHVCIHVLVSLTHAHTPEQLHVLQLVVVVTRVHAVPKQKHPDVFLLPFFCLQYVAQIQYMADTSRYMVWLRPGSSNICTILVSVYLNLLVVPDGWGLPQRTMQFIPESLDNHRKLRPLTFPP